MNLRKGWLYKIGGGWRQRNGSQRTGVVVRTRSGELKAGARWASEKVIIAGGEKKNNEEPSYRYMAEMTQVQTSPSHWSRTPHCLRISFTISLPFCTD